MSEYKPLIETYFPKSSGALFFDLETTGLSARSAIIYLIGTAAWENGQCVARQWLAEDPSEEAEILADFLAYAASYPLLVHFNGTTFDVPFVAARAALHKLPDPLPRMEQVDIYRKISGLKNLLKLPNCKQKSLEQFLGIFREDQYNGGQLIEVYYDYVRHRREDDLKALLLHNAEDVEGMLRILPILGYPSLFACEVAPQEVLLADCLDYKGHPVKELRLTLSCPYDLPVPITLHKEDIYLAASGGQVTIRVPVTEQELKYFYPDYKNYSYLPEEDQAVHKSVAMFVDKSRRVPATKQTCYTRRTDSYVRLPGCKKAGKGFSNLFLETFDAVDAYLRTTELAEDSQMALLYGKHLIGYLKK